MVGGMDGWRDGWVEEETVPAGERLGWGGDKRGVVVGDGKLKNVVPNVEPVRSHAGVNMAGPPAC